MMRCKFRNINMRLALLALFSLSGFYGHSQSENATTVFQGTTVRYSGPTSTSGLYGQSYSWRVTGGTVLQANITLANGPIYADITWGNTSSGKAEFVYFGQTTWSSGQNIEVVLNQYVVQIYSTPPVPTASISQTYNCGNTTVTQSNPVSVTQFYDWWWQTSPSGQSTALGKNASVTVSSSTQLYLAARLKVTPFTWSTAAQSLGTIPVYNTLPASPASASNAYGFLNSNVPLAVSTVSGATAYKWYGPDGLAISGATTNSYTTPALPSTQNYTVSAMQYGCESFKRRQVTAFLQAAPVIVPSGNGVLYMGNTVTLGTSEPYATYSWRNASNTVIGTQSTMSVSVAGDYRVVVTKNGVTGTGVSVFYSVKAGAATQNINHIITNTMQDNTITDPASVVYLPVTSNMQSIQYFDGVGRPIQSVATQASPLKMDIVAPVVYDQVGREHRKYLPFVSTENSGFFKTVTFSAEGNYTHNFYNTPNDAIADDARPFAESVFEKSPLNRVIKQGAPGTTWQPSASVTDLTDHTVKSKYFTNGSGEVLKFTYDMWTEKIVTTEGHYAAGTLQGTTTLDEHNNEVSQFTDVENRVVMKRVFVSVNGNEKKYASTYYVYDDFGNLVSVLPPESIRALTGSN